MNKLCCRSKMRKDLEGHDFFSFNAMECDGRILVEVSVCVDLVEFGALRSIDHMRDTQRLQHLEILCCRAAMICISGFDVVQQ